MTSATFGDAFAGSGALNGTASTHGSASATWTAATEYQRSASGATLTYSGTGGTMVATLAYSAIAFGSGTSVFEFSIRGAPTCYVYTTATNYARLGLDTAGNYFWRVLGPSFDNSSSGATGTARSGATTSVLRIEISTTDVKFYVDGTLVATSSSPWTTTDSTLKIAINFVRGVGSSGITGNSTPQAAAQYVNARTDGAAGALGAPAAADSTAPVMSGALTISKKNDTSYRVRWVAATDDTAVTGYQVSVAGGAYANIGNVLQYDVSGRPPNTTEAVAVRAYDAAGNFSTALTTNVTLAAMPVYEVLVGDCFTGSGAVDRSRCQIGRSPLDIWNDIPYVSPSVTGYELATPRGHLIRSARGGVETPHPEFSQGSALGMLFRNPKPALGAGTWVAEAKVTDRQKRVEWGLVFESRDSAGVAVLELVEALITQLPGGGISSSILHDFPNVYGGSTLNQVSGGSTPGDGGAVLRIEIDSTSVRTYANNVMVDSMAVEASAEWTFYVQAVLSGYVSEPTPALDYVHVVRGATSGPLGRPRDPFALVVAAPVAVPALNLAAALRAASVAASNAAAHPSDRGLVGAAAAAAQYAKFVASTFSPDPLIDPLVAKAADASAIAASVAVRSVGEPANPGAQRVAADAFTAAAAAWLGAATNAGGIDAGPADEPDGSFSSFWTSFVRTYEVS